MPSTPGHGRDYEQEGPEKASGGSSPEPAALTLRGPALSTAQGWACGWLRSAEIPLPHRRSASLPRHAGSDPNEPGPRCGGGGTVDTGSPAHLDRADGTG